MAPNNVEKTEILDSEFTENLQTLLDAQWDALEARNAKEARHIRREIGAALSALQQRRDEQAAELKKWSAKARQVAEKHRELSAQLDMEERGPVAVEILATDAELMDIERELSTLRRRKQELVSRKRDLENGRASRRVHWRELLADLPKPPPDDQIAEAGQQMHQIEIELEAARGGVLLWHKACSELTDLDRDLKLVQGIDQVPFMLARRISIFEAYRSEAEENKWGFLVVALTHELQILQDALTAVQQHA